MQLIRQEQSKTGEVQTDQGLQYNPKKSLQMYRCATQFTHCTTAVCTQDWMIHSESPKLLVCLSHLVTIKVLFLNRRSFMSSARMSTMLRLSKVEQGTALQWSML